MATINRIGGLASGMDIDQMVADLMKAHRLRLDKIKQEKQIWQWKQEDYRSINSSLLALRNEVFNLKLQGSFLSKTATSSNTSVVTAVASSSAAATSYQIRVERLATVATNRSAAPLRAGIESSEALTAPLSTVGANRFKISYDGGAAVEIALAEKVYDGGAGSTLQDLAADIQAKIDAALGAGKVNVSLTVEGKLKLTAMTKPGGSTVPALQVFSGDTDDALGVLKWSDGQEAAAQTALDPAATLASQASKLGGSFNWNEEHVFSFTINGETFEFDADTATLNSVIAAVNARKAAGVTMFYDPATDRIGIATLQTGDNREGAEIDFADVQGTFLSSVLQLSTANEEGGENASLEINGVRTTRSSNTFTVGGVTFTLQGVTSGGFSGQAATVTVSHDVDATVNLIKNFVNKYNETIELINNKLSEERYKDYLPLTEREIEEGKLTDKQIDQWEAKARSGLLRNDPLLRSALSEMRTALSSIVSGLTGTITVTRSGQQVTATANQLSVIGITTGSYYEKGKLYLDETRLREALQSNPEAVMELFTKNSDTASEKGIAVRLYDAVNSAMSRITSQAGSSTALYDNSSIGRKLREIDRRISTTEDQLAALEDRYWKQFTAMEEAIARMNSQSMWLTMQFMGNTGS